MSEKSKINFRGIGKGIIFSVIVTAILVLLIALLSYFADIPDKIVSIILFSSSVLSTLLGAFFVTRSIKENGLIHGMFIGLGYFIVILTASVIAKKEFDLNINILTMLISEIAGGMLGGILGINSK